jgi:hypothetical protein
MAVCGYLESEVFTRVVDLSGGWNTTERSAAAAAILSGVVFAQHIQPVASMVESARGAVSGLLPVRFPGPLNNPILLRDRRLFNA